jgi:hypothetical protein
MAKGKGGAPAPAKPVEVNRRPNGKAPKKNPKAADAGKTGRTVGGYKLGTPKADRATPEFIADKRDRRARARRARAEAVAAARRAKTGKAKSA